MSDPVQLNRLPSTDPGGTQPRREPPAAGPGTRASPPPAQRRSRKIMLTLVGIGALAIGYGVYDSFQDDEPQVAADEQRNGYSTAEECEGNYSKEQCTPGQTYRPGVGFIPIFWGPFYGAGAGGAGSAFVGRSPADPGPGRVSRGTVTETRPAPASARGGFGSSAGDHAGSRGS